MAHQAPLSSTTSLSLLKFMSTELVTLTISTSAAFVTFCLQSFPNIRVFSSVSSFHQVAKVLEVQL